MNGILIINKPANWTSHDVIAKLRGMLKQKRIGHGGTLDPQATGVLPVFIGRATRAAEFSENAEKEYTAEFKLGITTDTQDITGNIINEKVVTVTVNDLSAILPNFTGPQNQVPPMYSAIKKDGKKLYELARKGIEIPREPKKITIHKLELLNIQNLEHKYSLRIVCSKGTYIRTLCHDIGNALGCGATLTALHRTRAGVYSIESAFTLEETAKYISTDSVNEILLPTDTIFSDHPPITITDSETRKAKNGALCSAPGNPENGIYRVYAPNGEFLLLGEIKNNQIKTIKSFFEV